MTEQDAVLSFVCTHGDVAEPVVAYATCNGGAYVLRGDADFPVHTDASGGANPCANVMCIPTEWCSSINDLVLHLQQTGLGMPLQLKPASGASCCEGLLEVLLGSADIYLHPPTAFLHDGLPPPQVLCAFELLLREAGACLSDVYGGYFDLTAAVESPIYSSSSAVPLRGVLACVDAMHPYVTRATASAFKAPKPALDQVLDRMRLSGEYDGVASSARLLDDGVEFSL